MTTSRYYKINTMGFRNTATYIRIINDEQAAYMENSFSNLSDKYPSGYACWTSDKVARAPGVAFEFDDFINFRRAMMIDD